MEGLSTLGINKKTGMCSDSAPNTIKLPELSKNAPMIDPTTFLVDTTCKFTSLLRNETYSGLIVRNLPLQLILS